MSGSLNIVIENTLPFMTYKEIMINLRLVNKSFQQVTEFYHYNKVQVYGHKHIEDLPNFIKKAMKYTGLYNIYDKKLILNNIKFNDTIKKNEKYKNIKRLQCKYNKFQLL